MPSFPRSATSNMVNLPDEETLQEAAEILTRRGIDFAVQPARRILWTSAEGMQALQASFQVSDRPV